MITQIKSGTSIELDIKQARRHLGAIDIRYAEPWSKFQCGSLEMKKSVKKQNNKINNVENRMDKMEQHMTNLQGDCIDAAENVAEKRYDPLGIALEDYKAQNWKKYNATREDIQKSKEYNKEQFNIINSKLDGAEDRLCGIDTTLIETDKRLDVIEARLDNLEKKIDTRLNNLENKIDQILSSVVAKQSH